MDTPDVPILRVAAKAVILDRDGRVLIVREAKSGPDNTKVGLWELLGGRLEA
ncbi:MAG TPA: NUDIX domain-containing protein, partial [Candidatus Saccharimonadia bacterium]|nr:NUDIX domain-containing protein [Candidatus Saccharimonadia bacterium]